MLLYVKWNMFCKRIHIFAFFLSCRMSDYEVSLERSCDAEGRLGSFGLSILGGFSTKFPAVVCEIDPGGPADGTGLVSRII